MNSSAVAVLTAIIPGILSYLFKNLPHFKILQLLPPKDTCLICHSLGMYLMNTNTLYKYIIFEISFPLPLPLQCERGGGIVSTATVTAIATATTYRCSVWGP